MPHPQSQQAQARGFFLQDCRQIVSQIKQQDDILKLKRRWLLGLPLSKSDEKRIKEFTPLDDKTIPETLIREDDVYYDNIRSFVQRGLGVHNFVKEQDVQENVGSFDSDYLLNNVPSLLDKMTNEGLCCFAELLTDGLLEFEKTRWKLKKIIKEHLPIFINKGNHCFQMREKQFFRLLTDPQYFRGNHDVNWATTDYKAAAATVLDGLEKLPLATLSAMYRKLRGQNGYIPELGACESYQKYHLIDPVRQQCMKMLSELHEGEEPQELLVKTLAVAGLTFKLILAHPSGLEFRKFSPRVESLQNDITKAIFLIDSVNKVSTAEIEALYKKLQQRADSGVEFSEGNLRAAIKNLFTDFLFECGDMEIIPEHLLQAVFEINKRFHDSTCRSTSMEEMEQEVEFLLWMSAMTKQIVSDLLPEQDVDQDFANAYMEDLDESDDDEDEEEEWVDLPRNFKFHFDDSKGLSESFGETNPFDFGTPIAASNGDGSSSLLSPSSQLNRILGSVDVSEMDTFEPKDSINCSSCPQSKMLSNTQGSNGHEHQLASVVKLEPTGLHPSSSTVNLSGSSSPLSSGGRKRSHDVKMQKTVNDSARNAEFLHYSPSLTETGNLHHKQCKSGNKYLSIQRACDETSMAIYGTIGGMLDELALARNLDLRQDHLACLRCRTSLPNDSKGLYNSSNYRKVRKSIRDERPRPISSLLLFIDLMEEQVLKRNRPISTFTKQEWKSIEDELEKRTGFSYKCHQINYRYYCLRQIYKDFNWLIAQTGINSYNPATGMVIADEDQWKKYCQVNKNVKKFKRKGCPYYEKLRTIYGHTTTTSDDNIHPSTKAPSENLDDNCDEADPIYDPTKKAEELQDNDGEHNLLVNVGKRVKQFSNTKKSRPRQENFGTTD